MSPVVEMDLAEYLARADADPEFYHNAQVVHCLDKWIHCLTSAVGYIHSHKIRHKDLKPANILVLREEIYLTDFGISKDLLNDPTTGSIGYPREIIPKNCASETNVEGARRGRASKMFSLG